MKRHYTFFLDDILDSITAIEEFTKGMARNDFLKDGKTQSAVIWKIVTIGEASKNIPRHIRQKYSDVPWSEMAKMRDRIAHAYFGVSQEIVWAVVVKELPTVKPSILRILEELKGARLFQ
jgi:uncharacterized protein with HEPN domain